MKTTMIMFGAFIALVFNWFFFWLYAPASEVQWLCWGLFHAGLVGTLIFALTTTWKDDLSALLQTPSLAAAAITLVLTAAMSFGFVAWNPESPMIPLTGYVILFGAAIAFHVSWRSVSGSLLNSAAENKSGLTFIRQCVLALEYIIQSEPDLERKKELEVVSDALRSAQVASIPEAKPLESQIENDINQLHVAVNKKESTVEIQSRLLDAINQRNQIIVSKK